MIDIKNQTTEVLQQIIKEARFELCNRGEIQLEAVGLESLSIADLWALVGFCEKQIKELSGIPNSFPHAPEKGYFNIDVVRANNYRKKLMAALQELEKRNNEIFENLA